MNSLRARLTFWYVTTMGAALLVGAGFILLIAARTLNAELDATLDVRAQDAVTDMREALLALHPDSALAARRTPLPAGSAVRDNAGRLLDNDDAFPVLHAAAETKLLRRWRTGTRLATITDTSGVKFRVRTAAFARPGAEPLIVQIATSKQPLEQRLRRIAGGLLGGIIAVLTLAAVGSLNTVRRALAPVDAIIDRVQEVQRTGAHRRLEIRAGSAELERLIRKLNEMLAGIEGSVRSSRRFAADASHELQTPLAVMRAAVESCLLDPATSESHARMAEDLLAEIDRCSAVIRDLRLLALADAGGLLTSAETVDLAALVSECLEVARTLAEPVHVGVELESRDRPRVRGSALHLRRVVLNLATNAIHYSKPDSVVHVRVERSADGARVVIADQGCGIAAADLPHIFEPFYRADPARARDTGGTGLGLAIADQVARAHGGHIEVSSAVGVGSTFVLVLPALTEAATPAAAA